MITKLFSSVIISGLIITWSVQIQAKELKVGLGELDYPPFYFQKGGKYYGAAIEIAQYIAEKLGHTLSFERYPWRRVQFYLRTGKIDMVVLYFKTPEREKYVEYTDTPHLYESSYLIVSKGTEISYNGNLKELQSYKFGNVRGYSHGDKYNNASYLNKQHVNNEKLLIRMLLAERFDIAVGNKAVVNMYAKQEKLHDKISFLIPPIDKGPNFFAFSKVRKDANELVQAYSTEIRNFITTDAYRQILKKYGFDVPKEEY